MKADKFIYIFVLTIFLKQNICGQDFVRMGIAFDFKEKYIVQAFSFDFNRTEKISEKSTGTFFLAKNDFYILPTSDINIGEGITISENNILLQVDMGKAFYGLKRKSMDNLSTFVWNKAIEFNPSYNSDRYFKEMLTYGQLKFLLNFITSRHDKEIDFLKNENVFAIGLFSNIGYRFSKTYNTDDLYSTFGILLNYKTRLVNLQKDDNIIFILTGNYYYINSDVSLLTTEKFAGIVKSSIDKLIYQNTYLGLSYKFGNDNPYYQYIHSLELSAKININFNKKTIIEN